jgi:hypothetical protein
MNKYYKWSCYIFIIAVIVAIVIPAGWIFSTTVLCCLEGMIFNKGMRYEGTISEIVENQARVKSKKVKNINQFLIKNGIEPYYIKAYEIGSKSIEFFRENPKELFTVEQFKEFRWKAWRKITLDLLTKLLQILKKSGYVLEELEGETSYWKYNPQWFNEVSFMDR